MLQYYYNKKRKPMTSYTISGCAGAQSNLGTAPISAPTGKKAQILGLVGLAASSGIFLSLAGTHASMISSCGVAAGSSAVVKMLGLSALGTVLGTGGALAVLYIALLVGIVGCCWLIYKQSMDTPTDTAQTDPGAPTQTTEVEDNFSTHYQVDFRQATTDPTITPATTGQIAKDKERYNGLGTHIDAINKAVSEEQNSEIRNNILFANCQNFEISVARWYGKLFGENFIVSELSSNDMSSLVCDASARTSTLTCRFKVRDQQKEYQEVERFTVTATFDWDTAQVTMIKTPIQPKS
jgi:hypothetical protein